MGADGFGAMMSDIEPPELLMAPKALLAAYALMSDRKALMR